jgi:hypothetical protein
MVLKPARKVYYEIGDHSGRIFADFRTIYYRQFYYDNGDKIYQDEGTIDIDIVPNVQFDIGYIFEMPPYQGCAIPHPIRTPPPPPAPARPTRDSSRKSFEAKPNQLWRLLEWLYHNWVNACYLNGVVFTIAFVDDGYKFPPEQPVYILWNYLFIIFIAIIASINLARYLAGRLVRLVGVTAKHKPKHSTEQMATLAELFEGYDERPQTPSPSPRYPPTQDTAYRYGIIAAMIDS